jgi:hypothetical protein
VGVINVVDREIGKILSDLEQALIDAGVDEQEASNLLDSIEQQIEDSLESEDANESIEES